MVPGFSDLLRLLAGHCRAGRGEPLAWGRTEQPPSPARYQLRERAHALGRTRVLFVLVLPSGHGLDAEDGSGGAAHHLLRDCEHAGVPYVHELERVIRRELS